MNESVANNCFACSRRGDEAEAGDCCGRSASSRRRLPWVAACFVFLLSWTGLLQAQETPESRAFKTAARWFQNGVYDTAEKEFQAFVAAYPQSPMLAEAILLHARSALAQTNLARAVFILNSNMAKAGLITDQYRYRLAEAQMAMREFAGAAESYALLLRQFPNSSLALESAYGEALARFKRREFARVTALLRDANGAFQQAGKVRTSDRFTVSGMLLLAEAHFEQRQFAEAIEALQTLAENRLQPEYPEYDWERQHLLCRIHIAMQKLPDALAQSTNLVATANGTGLRGLVADSLALQAGVLRQMDRIDEAIAVYTNNLLSTVPEDRRRMALLNIIELKLAQDRTAEAGQMLQDFLAQRANDSASDVALITSGELQMRLHFDTAGEAVTAPSTNLLQLATAQFDKVGTNSPLRGKALLNKGWCLWLEKRVVESIPVFRAAIEALPFSEDLAVAKFKLADGLYAQGDYTNALARYRSLTNDFSGVPRVRASLFDQVLHQIVRSYIQLGDVEAASLAMSHLLAAHPESAFSERSLWLVGQEFVGAREPPRARQMFMDFVKRFPDRPLLPRVDLAIAETHFQEGNFKEAIAGYDGWLERHATNDLRTRAEFNRAWANAKAGRATNAFDLFTNFVARFPTNELAREAQFWVADEFHRQGDFTSAQRGYQIIAESTNWVRSRLTYQARMMAGRAAFSAQLWKDASDHFTKLIEDTDNCPVEILAEAYFALGDTIIRDEASLKQDSPAARPLDKYVEGKKPFVLLTQLSLFATNRLVAHLIPLAWGRIGDCSLQLASEDPKQYDNATNAYHQAMQHPAADLSTRSLAEFGLAHALEAQALDKDSTPESRTTLLKLAFDHYFNLVLGGNLTGRAQPDPVWVEKAGFAAARLAEAQQQWPLAINVYRTMQDVLEPLRHRLEEKIIKTSEQLRGEKK